MNRSTNWPTMWNVWSARLEMQTFNAISHKPYRLYNSSVIVQTSNSLWHASRSMWMKHQAIIWWFIAQDLDSIFISSIRIHYCRCRCNQFRTEGELHAKSLPLKRFFSDFLWLNFSLDLFSTPTILFQQNSHLSNRSNRNLFYSNSINYEILIYLVSNSKSNACKESMWKKRSLTTLFFMHIIDVVGLFVISAVWENDKTNTINNKQ